jgi:high-affinity nickel-transport protein
MAGLGNRIFDDSPRQFKFKASAILGFLIVANVVSWLWAYAIFKDRPALLGTALLAWVFGLRHAVDADHIAAIDNVVRKLMQEGKRPLTVGFFFSLGHSTIVLIASILIAATASIFQDDLESFKSVGGLIGTVVSAAFLLVIALANMMILKGVWRSFQRAKLGHPVHEESLDMLLGGGGLLARLFRPVFALIRRSWHMYPLGFLFGLGFDTATEIGLLGISATQAAQGVSSWDILVFPVLFASGMVLVDTADSMAMVGVYGWAFVHPLRKLWYNMTITAASVLVALLIGGVEALGLIGDELGMQGGFWEAIGALNDNLSVFGLVVIGVFALAWIVSAAIYKIRGYEDMKPVSAAQ